MTRVLLADDQALVRSGFRMILEAREDFEVAGEAEDGAEAVALARSLQPEVILMDVRMPKLDGIEATRQIVASGSPQKGKNWTLSSRAGQSVLKRSRRPSTWAKLKTSPGSL